MSLQIFDCDQGSPEWFAVRAGIPTASEFHTVMAVGPKGGKSVTRVDYLNKLAGEILTGDPMTSYVSADMERGKLMEDEARDLYAFQTGADLQRVGFIRNGNQGASPDSLIGTDGGLEIKSAAAHIQIKRLLADDLPSEHKAQVQGGLWVTGRQWWDFISYCPKLPLFIKRVHRDGEYIKTIAHHVELFNEELQQTVGCIRRYGYEPNFPPEAVASAAASDEGSRAKAAPPQNGESNLGGAAQPAKQVQSKLPKLTGLLAERHRDNLIRQIRSLDAPTDFPAWGRDGDAEIARLPEAMAEEVQAEFTSCKNRVGEMQR